MGVILSSCLPSARARPDGLRHDGICTADKALSYNVIPCSMLEMATFSIVAAIRPWGEGGGGEECTCKCIIRVCII